MLSSSSIRRSSPLFLLLIPLLLVACQSHNLNAFISTNAPVIALTHVRVIDGSGSPAKEDQTIIIESGRVKSIGHSSQTQVPSTAQSINLDGYTAIPGLVGMHDHLFYTTDRGKRDVFANASFPQLYLASGVTTIRTAGAFSLDSDWTTKKLVDNGQLPGPKIHLTSKYINHSPGDGSAPQKIAEQINQWADQGVTTLKVYTQLGRSDLESVIQSAHKRGLKVTGHLCAVGFREAAQAGIDNLEHGFIVDTEFYSGKKADECPDRSYWLPELVRIDVMDGKVQELIRELVNRRVAITSTLAIFESFTGQQFHIDSRMQAVLSPEAYADSTSGSAADPRWAGVWQVALKKEMQFEREFVKAGGLLMTGVDPTGWGGVIAGFGDQRGLELLVAAGFTSEEAIRIATLNGATFLGEADRIGTLTAGKQADIVILRGNPSANISDVRNVHLVFKDGVGYDPAKLLESVRGLVGER